MNVREWERLLRLALADRRLSAGEKSAIVQSLADDAPDAQQEGVLRAKLFEMAAGEAGDPRFRELLAWVEDVLKVLHPTRPLKPASPAGMPGRASEALFAPRDSIVGRLISLFDTARQAVDAAVFTITDDRIAEAMLRAHRRKVAVRVVTDNDKANDLGADIARLEEAGIEVRVDRTEAHMHHKFAVFDGAVLATGSYNWTRSAQGFNNENLVVTGESRLVEAFEREFAYLWERLK